jgi:hypothetical protein
LLLHIEVALTSFENSGCVDRGISPARDGARLDAASKKRRSITDSVEAFRIWLPIIVPCVQICQSSYFLSPFLSPAPTVLFYIPLASLISPHFHASKKLFLLYHPAFVHADLADEFEETQLDCGYGRH